MAQELNIHLDTDSKKPLYRQIYEYIRGEIRSGSLTAGERLPSTRALASYLQVARSTTELAYSQLLSEGYIHSRRNSGYYINEIENFPNLRLDQPLNPMQNTDFSEKNDSSGTGSADSPGDSAEKKEEIIDFSLRHTEMSAFPYSTWKRIMREVMVDANSEMFSHSEPGGDLSLRTTIARYLHFSRGVRCLPEQIIVGAGNDYLLMLLRHILGEERTVAMEDPSYLRAAQIFLSFGYRICHVRMDRDGMLPESVAESGADLVYAMPAHQFPMGCVMPVARRTAMLRWASEKPDRFIIEDDYDSEFRYRGKPIPALQSLDTRGKVIYIGTFSKAIAPAIRISYMILPQELLERYREKCWFFSSTVSRIDQRILNEFMHNGHFERHLNRMRSLYHTRHDELVSSLAPFRKWFSVRGTGTGLHLVLQVRPEYLEREKADRAAASGENPENTDLNKGNTECEKAGLTAASGENPKNKNLNNENAEYEKSGLTAASGEKPGNKNLNNGNAEYEKSGLTAASGENPGNTNINNENTEYEKSGLTALRNRDQKALISVAADDPGSAKEIEHMLAERALTNGVRVYCLSDFRLPDSFLKAGREEPDGNPTGLYDDSETDNNGKVGLKIKTQPDLEDNPKAVISDNNGKVGLKIKTQPDLEDAAEAGILLGFGALDPGKIREGIHRLAKAWNIFDQLTEDS